MELLATKQGSTPAQEALKVFNQDHHSGCFGDPCLFTNIMQCTHSSLDKIQDCTMKNDLKCANRDEMDGECAMESLLCRNPSPCLVGLSLNGRVHFCTTKPPDTIFSHFSTVLSFPLLQNRYSCHRIMQSPAKKKAKERGRRGVRP